VTSSTLKPGQKIPATIVTGFLGAGKTTLIRNLLQNSGGKRIALIVNEFGDMGFDGSLVNGCADPSCSAEEVVELTNGCICCTVADDFLPTMEMLLARENPPEHIVIETSGLALPQPLVRAFSWPSVKPKVTVDGVVTVLDAAALAEGRIALDEAALEAQRAADEALDHESPVEELFQDQLRCADLVVLNKADLVAGDILAGVQAKIAAEVRPAVHIVASEKALCRSRFCLAAAQRLRMTWPPVTNITITTMMMTITMITMIIITTTTTIMIITTTMTLKAM
jgi:cobalamin biosynthesis protein CobW